MWVWVWGRGWERREYGIGGEGKRECPSDKIMFPLYQTDVMPNGLHS